ncbi:hypothetical protein [Agaribacter flavus]|uniref:Uncharacterized protein n=1 Tax=Agaribacter flavus TaxID=1902781 RepID=A0ABV7FQD3_9ALTE
MKHIFKLLMLGVSLLTSEVYASALYDSVKQQNWSEAYEYVDQEKAKCEQNQDNHCDLKARFSYAWVQTKEAETSDLAHSRKLLHSARDSYEHILKQHPNHSASLSNLVLVLQTLKDVEGMISLLPKIKNPIKSAELAEMIALASHAEGDISRAFEYRVYAFQKDKSEAALTGLTELFSEKDIDDGLLETWAKKLLALAKNETDNQLAASLYAAVANREKRLNRKTWDQAALGWTILISEARQLDKSIVEANFSLEKSAVFRELQTRLTKPSLGVRNIDLRLNSQIMSAGQAYAGWWTRNHERAHALAMAGWSLGHNYLINGDPQSANAVWLGALYYSPPTAAYRRELKGKQAISLDLLTELARLQHLYKSQLDPNGRNFKSIENLLFNSKSKAYKVNDLEAIQRHHTVLGKLYADLGVFKNDYRGAEFQLTHAIKTSQSIAKQKDSIAPQPALSKLLADGYNCALPKQTELCNKNNKKAKYWYTQATIDSLDVDALHMAQKSINALEQLPEGQNQVTLQLKNIVRTRSTLGKATPIDADWLKNPAIDLSQDFIKRQRFKAFSQAGLQGDKKSTEQALKLSNELNIFNNVLDLNTLKKLEEIEEQ